jgi:hypothetical protein
MLITIYYRTILRLLLIRRNPFDFLRVWKSSSLSTRGMLYIFPNANARCLGVIGPVFRARYTSYAMMLRRKVDDGVPRLGLAATDGGELILGLP